MGIILDRVQNSTAPTWTDEERAALLTDQLAGLVHVLDRHYWTLPFSVLDQLDRAKEVLKEVNGEN